MWFQTPKKVESLKSDEYESILKRVIDLEQRIRRLELNEVDLRDKVLRKIQMKSLALESTPSDSNAKYKKRFGGTK